jgi:hypothetical protein
MGLFKHELWRIDEVPRIRLGAADAQIDIGFLGGDEHRRAFAALFRRAFQDNPDLLDGRELVEIHAERIRDLAGIHLPLPLYATELESLALRLYDSQNETIGLVLRRDTDLVELNVTFDNPSFWLSHRPRSNER